MAKKLPVPGYLTYADVADALSCSPRTVKRLWYKGVLPAPVDVEGVGPRFLEDEILTYLARTRTSPRMTPPRAKPPPAK